MNGFGIARARAPAVLAVVLAMSALAAMGCKEYYTHTGSRGAAIQGTGLVTARDHAVAGIASVVTTNQGDLLIEIGDNEGLVIEAQDNLHEYITVDVHGGTLEIGTKRGVGGIKSDEPILYHLTVRQLEAVTSTSAGDIDAGDITIEALYATRLEARLTSAGDVTIEGGAVEVQDVLVSSAGDYRAIDMESVRAEVVLSSAGDASVWVRDELDASLSSVGDLVYTGDPTVDVHRSSQGQLIHRP